nr:SDR family oxidoreductase [Conexibacter arvalis]
MAGRVALVTGANHGIGAATAIALATRGADVLVSYLALPHASAGDGDPPGGGPAVDATDDAVGDDGIPLAYHRSRARDAGWVVTAIETIGGRALAVEADLSDPAAPAALLDAAERALGPVEIVVCNATGWVQDSFSPAERDAIGRPLAPVTAATFNAQFAVDARATALLIAEFARRHVARGGRWGRIVSLTSEGRDGFPSEVSYGAAKAALESYTLSAAHELAPHGVTANVVHPPVTDTGWIAESARPAMEAHSPFGTVAHPEDVAGAIALLCLEESARVTANVIRMR